MLFFEQLDFLFDKFSEAIGYREAPPSRRQRAAKGANQRDSALESEARTLLRPWVARLPEISVEWNRRLRTAAGRVDFQKKLISLNPRLREHDAAEIDRTLRHELAHLLAHFRAGRR